MKKILIPLLTIFLAAACSPLQATPALQAIPPLVQTLPTLTEEPAPVPQAESPSAAWKEVRDARYGFGLAVPCWWLVSPIPPEGFGGVMGLTNYDEAYFMANSQKGFWDWPNGTLKIDVVVMEDINPALSDTDAYMAMVDTSMEGLVAFEAKQTGLHTATVLTLQNQVNQNDPPVRIFLYRLAPDKLIMLNPIPQSIIDTPDFQAILASIVLTPQEPVLIPTSLPIATPLIEASCAQ
jgi:hypothetical protein